MSFAYKRQLEAVRSAVLDKGDTKFKTPTAEEARKSASGLMSRQVEEVYEASAESSDMGLGLTMTEALSQYRPKARPEPEPLDSVRPKSRFDNYEDTDGFNRITKKLVSRGLPEHIAKAFAINMKDESGINSSINEKNPLVKGSRGGYGLYQLTGSRRKAYEMYADKIGADYGSEDAQLDFLMMELQGAEKGAWAKIKSATDVSSAAVSIVNNFLRPAEKHRRSRASRYSSLGY